MDALLPNRKIEPATTTTTEQSVGPARRLFRGCLRTLDSAADAYLALAYSIRDLRTKLATAPPQGAQNVSFHQNNQSLSRILAIPGADSIPFTYLMDLPVPFSDRDLSHLATCHMRRMMDLTFLQDGAEWGGYYSLPTWYDHSGEVGFDPAMHGIRFTASELVHTGDIWLHGTGGIDGVGAFELRGTIDGKTGALRMEKIYVNLDGRWGWVGFLTPFGITASWGEQWGGWVWLYKTAWCSTGASIS
ncbi:MAG: hypothetical protein Q9192_006575 [Flavoplaca navasiana]